MLLQGQADRLGRNVHIVREGLTQRILHCVLAIAGRELQNLQVFTSPRLLPSSLAKPVVGDAKVRCGKHFLAVPIVLERTRLANERVDHVAIIDRALAGADQARHPLNRCLSIPDFNEVGVDHHIDLVTNEAAGNRVRIPLDSNRATGMHADSWDPRTVVQPSCR